MGVPELSDECRRAERRLDRMRMELEVRHLLSELLPKFLNRALEERGYGPLKLEEDDDAE